MDSAQSDIHAILLCHATSRNPICKVQPRKQWHQGASTHGPRTMPLEAQGQSGAVRVDFCFGYGVESMRMLSSSLLCELKHSCHVLQFHPARVQLSNCHTRVGTSGTPLLWAPSSNWPGGHFAGASTGQCFHGWRFFKCVQHTCRVTGKCSCLCVLIFAGVWAG